MAVVVVYPWVSLYIETLLAYYDISCVESSPRAAVSDCWQCQHQINEIFPHNAVTLGLPNTYLWCREEEENLYCCAIFSSELLINYWGGTVHCSPSKATVGGTSLWWWRVERARWPSSPQAQWFSDSGADILKHHHSRVITAIQVPQLVWVHLLLLQRYDVVISEGNGGKFSIWILEDLSPSFLVQKDKPPDCQQF